MAPYRRFCVGDVISEFGIETRSQFATRKGVELIVANQSHVNKIIMDGLERQNEVLTMLMEAIDGLHKALSSSEEEA